MSATHMTCDGLDATVLRATHTHTDRHTLSSTKSTLTSGRNRGLAGVHRMLARRCNRRANGQMFRNVTTDVQEKSGRVPRQ